MELNGADYYASQAETFEVLYKGLEWVQDSGTMEGSYFSEGSELDGGRGIYDELVGALDIDYGDDITEDMIYEAIHEMALSIDTEKVYTVWLSMGGPNAYIEVKAREGIIGDMVYHFGWGGERYTKTLHEDDAMGRYAAHQVEGMIEAEM